MNRTDRGFTPAQGPPHTQPFVAYGFSRPLRYRRHNTKVLILKCHSSRGPAFQTADDVRIDEISRNARAKNIADALIENQFRRYARVDAAEDRRKWRLPGRTVLHLSNEVAISRFARKRSLPC
jgi:hypothetical protein